MEGGGGDEEGRGMEGGTGEYVKAVLLEPEVGWPV